jgi:type I restriction-modification system DNA methylase subunit
MKTEYFCANCGKKLLPDEHPCSQCGKEGRNIKQNLEDTVPACDNTRFRATLKSPDIPGNAYEITQKKKISAHKKLRKILLEKCQLEAVISMPSGVFKPYAGVSTAVLVFIKGDKTEKIWFYNMQADGYSLDDKRTPIDCKGDIPDIIERFRKRYKENPTDRKGKCFYVPFNEIKENGYDLSISKYKEIVYEEVHYEKPEIIIGKIEELEDKIKSNLIELKKMLK